MRHIGTLILLFTLIVLSFSPAVPVLAQATTPTGAPPAALTLYTAYPSQVIGIGENVTLPLQLRAPTAGVIQLEMQDSPENWTATFRGAGRIVQSVYVQPDSEAAVDLRLEPPADVAPGAYNFTVVARGDGTEAELPIALTIQEKVPPKLSFAVDLPTLRGRPSTTFRYDVTLQNEGDEDLNVTLAAEAPNTFQVTFNLNSQEVTDIPLAANESKRLSVSAQPQTDIQAGTYPITIRAQGGEATAETGLAAEVTGQADLVITAPDGRLSGNAYAGADTPFQVTVQNNGSAPVRAIELSASNPSGWSVAFEPAQIDEIAPGQQVDVTASVQPPDQAIAGDYMLTITARPQDGSAKSVDFRITVLTSTLWGVAGVALIAVAVGVVALAVGRFGRR